MTASASVHEVQVGGTTLAVREWVRSEGRPILFWHALGGIWAMQAGKDVLVEKPVSHNVWEGRQLVAAATEYNRVCQSGTHEPAQLFPDTNAIDWGGVLLESGEELAVVLVAAGVAFWAVSHYQLVDRARDLVGL